MNRFHDSAIRKCDYCGTLTERPVSVPTPFECVCMRCMGIIGVANKFGCLAVFLEEAEMSFTYERNVKVTGYLLKEGCLHVFEEVQKL